VSAAAVREVLEALAEIRDLDAGLARSLPTGFYTSEEYLELEKEKIFRKEWVCLGRVAEIPKRGDYFTTQLLDEPLIVVRGQDNKVRVLSNVCRHRSSVIVEGKGTAKHFVCPYHAWSYANDGQLVRAPHMDKVKGFEVKSCRLPEFATEVWHGFLYVNLDGKTKPLAPRLKGLEPYLQNRHVEDMVVSTVLDEFWPTNWKCLAENYMEGYHLNTVHSKALYDITPTRLCEKIPPGEGYTGYKAHYTRKTPSTRLYHPDVTPEERRFSLYFWVFPSHAVSITFNGSSSLCLQPRGVDEVANRCTISSYEPPAARNLAARLRSRGATMDEDREQLERMRRGLKSRYVQPNSLGPADLEGTVWDLYQYAARMLTPKKAPRKRLKRAS
jgi:phenylpropionate dioxygenase-like ring-hydroxylating dioxygenase large terminal subunit